MSGGRPWFRTLALALGFAFLYVPIVSLVVFSFNESRLVTVWGGFSTKWYGALFRDQQLLDAIWVTFRVGLISATIATILGTVAARSVADFSLFQRPGK